MRYIVIVCLFIVHTSFLFSRPSFFNYDNSLKLGAGTGQCNSVPGGVLQAEYTRHVANSLFASFRVSFANATDNALNAKYENQELTSADLLLKINPIMTNRHIVSLSIGLTQSFYSYKGNYGDGTLSTPTGFAPYSKSIDRTGYSFGGNYDFLFSRFYFLSVGGGAIKYDATMYYLSLSIGTIF